ncbi:MAG TPA: SRPBCC domain-containing protein, partial [Sphingomicrobium sp.]|nr:SRPBCC domain-containing protein [Sphingomicrobium sp.]
RRNEPMLILLAAMATEQPVVQPGFEPMAFLVGHCWEGVFEDGKTDTHCFDTVYDGQHIRDRHEVTGGKSVYRGETIYSRDGQGVTYTYWNSLGGVSRGTMKGEGDRLDFGTEHHRTKDGKEIAIATHWQRQREDAYQAVTSSADLPSMNRTMTYRRVEPPIAIRIERATDGSQALVHETTLDASPSDAWNAIATADGWKSWAVPTAWLDGNMLETSYATNAAPGDETTIRQQIILKVPERLIVFRTTKAPKGFPHFESFQRTTHWIELEPAGNKRTRVRLVSAGYADDEAGKQLAAFFTEGNRISLERLRRRFAEGPIDWAKEGRTAER